MKKLWMLLSLIMACAHVPVEAISTDKAKAVIKTVGKSKKLSDKAKRILIGITGGMVGILLIGGSVYGYKWNQRRRNNLLQPLLGEEDEGKAFNNEQTDLLINLIKSKKYADNIDAQIRALIAQNANPNAMVDVEGGEPTTLLQLMIENNVPLNGIQALVQKGATVTEDIAANVPATNSDLKAFLTQNSGPVDYVMVLPNHGNQNKTGDVDETSLLIKGQNSSANGDQDTTNDLSLFPENN